VSTSETCQRIEWFDAWLLSTGEVEHFRIIADLVQGRWEIWERILGEELRFHRSSLKDRPRLLRRLSEELRRRQESTPECETKHPDSQDIASRPCGRREKRSPVDHPEQLGIQMVG